MKRITHFMLGAVSAAVMGFGSVSAMAAFPDKPIHLVIGFPPGSATDIATRIIANKMSEELGQQFVVENKPGATTNIAGQYVARSTPDGYTLFIAGSSNSTNPSLLKNVPFDILKDFTPIGMAASVPSILVVNPSLGVSTVPELVALAKKSPGKIFFASSGAGTISHLSGELFGMTTGGKMTHVPYKGSTQAVVDLLAGSVPVMFAPASTVLPYIKNGRLKALATTGLERSRIAPDLPTVAETGVKDYDIRIWYAVVAPAGTPPSVVKTLAAALDKATASQQVKDQLAAEGIDTFHGDGAQFTKYMTSELAKWSKVIKDAGIQPD